MVTILVWNPYDRLLKGMLIMLDIICSLLYISRGRQQVEKNDKIYLYGISCLFIGVVIVEIISYVNGMLFSGNYINYAFYGEPTEFNMFISTLEPITTYVGGCIAIYSFERYAHKKKHLLSSVLIILIIIYLILFSISIELTRFYHFNIASPILLTIEFIVLIFLIRWSSYELKPIATALLFGLTLLAIGSVLPGLIIREYTSIFWVLSPFFKIAGIILWMSPLLMNPNNITSRFKYWKISGITIIIVEWLLFISFLLIGIIISDTFLLLVLSILTTLGIIYNLKILENSDPDSVKKADLSQDQDLLRIFTRPKQITEEEVSVSKEKKICLVCKGSISRYTTYICPECNTFYCHKCAKTLEAMENACWICDTPFDESKPVKKQESMDRDIEIESAKHKKKSKEEIPSKKRL